MNKSKKELPSQPKCGIVMPISEIDGCNTDHWKEVLGIIKDSIKEAGFEANLVSDADDSGIIQKRIIQNLYSNEIVVCDVSCKNPNVMFELGMRLAFDKPTIIIKDDKTDYSFDTSVIEHLSYPRDLRFSKIVSFKDALKNKITGTHKKATSDKNYTTFLKHFGEYKVAQLSEKEVSSEKYIISAIEDLRRDVYNLARRPKDFGSALTVSSDLANLRFQNILTFVDERIPDFLKETNLKSISQIYVEHRENDLLLYLIQCLDKKNTKLDNKDLKEAIEILIDSLLN